MTDFNTVSYDAFLPYVLPHVAGCPEKVATTAIRDACIAFCEESNLLAYDVDTMPARANVKEYEIDDIPAGTAVTSILSVRLYGMPSKPKTEDWLDDNAAGWRDLAGNGHGFYIINPPAFLRLVPYPDTTEANVIDVRVALKPTRDSSTVNDRLFQDYAPEIGYGALARLMAFPGKAWSNGELAEYNRLRFEQAIGGAKIDVRKGYTRASIFVSPRELGS